VKPETAVKLDRSVGRVVYKMHRLVYKLTGGKVGQKFEGRQILLLTTTGRKTGQQRTQPLLFYPHGDEWVVVGSNGGRPETPAWVFNIEADAKVTVQLGKRTSQAKARIVTGAEREDLWPKLTKYYPGWAHYTTLTDREMPVVLLSPEG
jgi:deazaflavin-dependent oxidoreductase (nitroreductase family)